MTADLNLYLVTWNVGESSPPKHFTKLLGLDKPILPDLYAIGLQELKSNTTTLISDSIFDDAWTLSITNTLWRRGYVRVKSIRLVGIHLSVYIKREQLLNITNIETDHTRTGLGGLWGNKGAVSIRLDAFGVNLCIVNSHLSAHAENFAERIEECNQVLHSQKFRDINNILDHDYVFWIGDLNFRLDDLGNEEVRQKVKEKDFDFLLQHDQLIKARDKKLVFPSFEEGTINFPPTFKFDVNSDEYDTSLKNRVPSWCDRVLWRYHEDAYSGVILSVQRNEYTTFLEYKNSDHKPVVASFTIKVLKDQPMSPVMFEPLGSWSRNVNQDLTYSISKSFLTSSRDWIGLFPANFMHLEDYSTYVWVSSNGEDNKDGTFLYTVNFEERHLSKLPSGQYQFLYISDVKKCVIGYSNSFKLLDTGPEYSAKQGKDEVDLRAFYPEMVISYPCPTLQRPFPIGQFSNRMLPEEVSSDEEEETKMAEVETGPVTGVGKNAEKQENYSSARKIISPSVKESTRPIKVLETSKVKDVQKDDVISNVNTNSNFRDVDASHEVSERILEEECIVVSKKQPNLESFQDSYLQLREEAMNKRDVGDDKVGETMLVKKENSLEGIADDNSDCKKFAEVDSLLLDENLANLTSAIGDLDGLDNPEVVTAISVKSAKSAASDGDDNLLVAEEEIVVMKKEGELYEKEEMANKPQKKDNGGSDVNVDEVQNVSTVYGSSPTSLNSKENRDTNSTDEQKKSTEEIGNSQNGKKMEYSGTIPRLTVQEESLVQPDEENLDEVVVQVEKSSISGATKMKQNSNENVSSTSAVTEDISLPLKQSNLESFEDSNLLSKKNQTLYDGEGKEKNDGSLNKEIEETCHEFSHEVTSSEEKAPMLVESVSTKPLEQNLQESNKPVVSDLNTELEAKMDVQVVNETQTFFDSNDNISGRIEKDERSALNRKADTDDAMKKFGLFPIKVTEKESFKDLSEKDVGDALKKYGLLYHSSLVEKKAKEDADGEKKNVEKKSKGCGDKKIEPVINREKLEDYVNKVVSSAFEEAVSAGNDENDLKNVEKEIKEKVASSFQEISLQKEKIEEPGTTETCNACQQSVTEMKLQHTCKGCPKSNNSDQSPDDDSSTSTTTDFSSSSEQKTSSENTSTPLSSDSLKSTCDHAIVQQQLQLQHSDTSENSEESSASNFDDAYMKLREQALADKEAADRKRKEEETEDNTSMQISSLENITTITVEAKEKVEEDLLDVNLSDFTRSLDLKKNEDELSIAFSNKTSPGMKESGGDHDDESGNEKECVARKEPKLLIKDEIENATLGITSQITEAKNETKMASDVSSGEIVTDHEKLQETVATDVTTATVGSTADEKLNPGEATVFESCEDPSLEKLELYQVKSEVTERPHERSDQ